MERRTLLQHFAASSISSRFLRPSPSPTLARLSQSTVMDPHRARLAVRSKRLLAKSILIATVKPMLNTLPWKGVNE